MSPYTARIGHAHLKVRDLARAVEFYTRFLGLRITERIDGQFAFLSGGDLHHELALQALGRQAPSPPQHSVGLYHVAFEVPDRRAFAEAFSALASADVRVTTVDHGISWAMYFSDPDGNGVEIYWDTRREPHGNESWAGRNEALGAERILAAE
jgi:catechol 2,3-dioxygenase